MVKAKTKILPPVDGKLVAKAKRLDMKIREAVKESTKSFVNLAGLLAEMKTNNLWRVVTDENHSTGFEDWDEYARSVLGAIGRTRFFELLAINELTTGPHALAQSTVERMGLKKGYEISRLEPRQRNPEVMTLAVSAPLALVKAKVQEILNAELPKDRQKEPTATFVKVLTPEIIAKYQVLEQRGVWMTGICDHDRTLTSKQKLFLAMIDNFEANHEAELKEADQRRLEYERDQAYQATKANGLEAVHETTTWAGKSKSQATAGY